jgi:hypothetical protein
MAESSGEPYTDPPMLDALRRTSGHRHHAPSHRALVELCAPRTRLVICQKPIADTHSTRDHGAA